MLTRVHNLTDMWVKATLIRIHNLTDIRDKAFTIISQFNSHVG